MTNGRMKRVSESGAPHRVGGFRYSRTEDEWEWSDNVATMHGYRPGEVIPTTELLLSHKHPDDRRYVAQTLDAIRTSGVPFSSRQRLNEVTHQREDVKHDATHAWGRRAPKLFVSH